MTEISLHIYRYGESRNLPGLSIGVARHPPRGIPVGERASRGYFDVWLPILAPSRELVSAHRNGEISFAEFSKKYRREMNRPEPKQIITLLATLATERRINLGCFCGDASKCHRTILHELIRSESQNLPKPSSPAAPASPPCYLNEFWDADLD